MAIVKGFPPDAELRPSHVVGTVREETSGPYVEALADAKTVTANNSDPSHADHANNWITVPKGSGVGYVGLREAWAGGKTTGATIGVYGRWKNADGTYHYAKLRVPGTAANNIAFGTTSECAYGGLDRSATSVMALSGASDILVVVTTASNAATSSKVEARVMSPVATPA